MVDESNLKFVTLEREDNNFFFSSISFVLLFSFFSVVFLFIAMILLGGFNNYAINDLLSIINQFINIGLIPSDFSGVADGTAENLSLVIFYLDTIWLGSFISMVISGLILSYNMKRENYFNLFTMSVLGLILFTYIGSFVIQLTDWFKTEILFSVFPTLSSLTPFFSFYLNNMGIINLVLICLNIIANFVDLDFSKFNKRKEEENLDEI